MVGKRSAAYMVNVGSRCIPFDILVCYYRNICLFNKRAWKSRLALTPRSDEVVRNKNSELSQPGAGCPNSTNLIRISHAL